MEEIIKIEEIKEIKDIPKMSQDVNEIIIKIINGLSEKLRRATDQQWYMIT